jgi:Putative zinc-finger
MTVCIGKPAELCALPYVEGSLPEPEAERFEEHYFECRVCLAHLQSLLAVRGGLGRMPAWPDKDLARQKTVLGWPRISWALAAAAAVLLFAAVFSYRAVHSVPRQMQASSTASGTAPGTARAAAPQAVPHETPAAAPARRIRASAPTASALADLSLPAFVAPNLRGAAEDESFDAGMKAYTDGDCRGALDDLAKVPAQSKNRRAADFYSAACEMHLGDLKAAAAGMHSVESVGDSPQQESALYYEAQIALANDNPAAAHRYLVQTIALQGDLERQARSEDRKVRELVSGQGDESAGK